MSEAEVERYLAAELAGRAQAAYLFGSWRSERFDRHSDIDLIVVAESELPFVERGIEFADLRTRLPALEILVYTPEEFAQLTTDPSPGFWRSVVASLHQVF